MPNLLAVMSPPLLARLPLASVRLRIRTLIVEDRPGAHHRLHRWLERAPGLRHLGCQRNSTALGRKLPALQPDVVLLALAQPNDRGIELLHTLLRQVPEAQIVVLAQSRDVEHIFAVLGAGATGYLNLSAPRAEVLSAISEAHAGGAPLSSDVARIVVCSFWHQPAPENGVAALSDQERAVLELLAAGCLYKEAASRLGIGINTVNTYVRRMYLKLQVRSRAQAVAKLFKCGTHKTAGHPVASEWRELGATAMGIPGR